MVTYGHLSLFLNLVEYPCMNFKKEDFMRISNPPKRVWAAIRGRFIYDDETGLVYRRTANQDRIVGSSNNCGYLSVSFYFKGKYYNFLVHRLAWFLHYGSWPEGELDHIDRNKHNNRVTNLRISSHVDNCKNRSSYKWTDELVDQLIAAHHSGVSQNTLAGIYNISQSYLSRLFERRPQWKKLGIFGRKPK